MCDIHELWFRIGGRSCKISFYGKNKFPDAVFYWDDCELFRFNADDTKLLVEVINRWICDSAMPSAMRVDFAWILIGELADFYEIGNPVEGEFIDSWNFIERFYADLNFSFTPKVLELITAMRKEGYDKLLRAGQSLSTLILSRARRHGLRNDQPSVTFQFRDAGMIIHDNTSNNKSLILPQIKLTSEVDSILKNLSAMNID
jgi:hypothetical protein